MPTPLAKDFVFFLVHAQMDTLVPSVNRTLMPARKISNPVIQASNVQICRHQRTNQVLNVLRVQVVLLGMVSSVKV